MESARMALRPRVDVALRDDGSGGVARVARGRMESAEANPRALSRAMGAQRIMDADIFRNAPNRPGIARNLSPLVGAELNRYRILTSAPRCRGTARAVSRMGEFCGGAELHSVAAQLAVEIASEASRRLSGHESEVYGNTHQHDATHRKKHRSERTSQRRL